MMKGIMGLSTEKWEKIDLRVQGSTRPVGSRDESLLSRLPSSPNAAVFQ